MIINSIIAGGGSRYSIKSQLVLTAPTTSSYVDYYIPDLDRTFVSGTDTIRAFVVPTTGNGTYTSFVILGGSWNDGNQIRLMVHTNTSSTYQQNAYYVLNQSRNTSFATTATTVGQNLLNYCMEFVISPDRQVCGTAIVNKASSATSVSTQYHLFKNGDYRFVCVNHTRYENGVNTTIANFLPATDGTSNGLIDTITNTFYPVENASII